jgi:hypothetical protein
MQSSDGWFEATFGTSRADLEDALCAQGIVPPDEAEPAALAVAILLSVGAMGDHLVGLASQPASQRPATA